jgi:hypothetical protein
VTAGDRLLYTLSAKVDLSWSSFKKLFELLCGPHLAPADLEDAGLARYETARGFDALGHVELDLGSSLRIYAAPPALALLPISGIPEAVFAGARSPRSMDEWRERAHLYGSRLELDVQLQKDGSGKFPSRVSVKAETRDDLQSFANDIRVDFQGIPASWRILNFAGSLSEFLADSEWQRFEKQNWEERQFNPVELRFSTALAAGQTTLIKYIHPSRQYPIYFLRRGAEAARTDPDWGRFAILSGANRNVIHYERCCGSLLLPASIPLPRLFGRALCLCSGLVPRLIPGSLIADSEVTSPLMRLYANIPREFAQVVAEKLNQQLITDFTLLDN